MHQVLPEKEDSSSTVPRDQLTDRERETGNREREKERESAIRTFMQ